MTNRKSFVDRDKNWVSFWEALVKTVHSDKPKSEYCRLIREMKVKLFGKECWDHVFTVADGVFSKIRRIFKESVRIFVGKIVNDNCNLRRCVFAVSDTEKTKPLNLLVAQYREDEFAQAFKKRTELTRWSSGRAHRFHDVSNDVQAQQSGSGSSDVNSLVAENDRLANNDGVDDDDDSDGDEMSFVDFDRLTDDASSVREGGVNAFIDGECGYLSDHHNYYDGAVEQEEQENNDDDDDGGRVISADSSLDVNADYRRVQQELYEEYSPIRNVLSIAPNVFSDGTRVSIIPESSVKKMPKCKTKGCLYSTSRPSMMRKHERSCSAEPIEFVKQTVEGDDIMCHIVELSNEKFLPCSDNAQEFFVCYDIECLMDGIPFSSKTKYHNLARIATYTSDHERECFVRSNDSSIGVLIMCGRFINYLLSLQAAMANKVPKCIEEGINHYSAKIDENDKNPTESIETVAIWRKKLRYLKDFYKLKIYAWSGERYDLRILFTGLVSMMYKYVEEEPRSISHITRGTGIMMLEALNSCFRDFRNYTSPMSLSQLAKSSGLDEELFVKGSFPYEWYTTIDQLRRAKYLSAYPCFNSTMTIANKKYVQEMNEIIAARVQSGEWDDTD
ncbi:unnamed protein product [Oikopleura dioica]|uniref:Uncharacterized protein n=1 Tax=Oikopleura dioica TaxID=34765 RepID=E4Y049_OIKDI|nr:unnamed protein product [Oikopleura dioica]